MNNSILDRLRDGMCSSQGGGGTEYHKARTDLAAALAAVDVALVGAYVRTEDRHGLGAHDCLRVLFARTVGDEVTERGKYGHSVRTRVRPDLDRIAAIGDMIKEKMLKDRIN